MNDIIFNCFNILKLFKYNLNLIYFNIIIIIRVILKLNLFITDICYIMYYIYSITQIIKYFINKYYLVCYQD
jgi:hypothetical protein